MRYSPPPSGEVADLVLVSGLIPPDLLGYSVFQVKILFKPHKE